MTIRHLEDIEAQWPTCPTREARRRLWEQLTGVSGLWFSACRDIVSQRDARTLASWLDPDDPIKHSILNFDASRSAVLRAYLLCARLALTRDRHTEWYDIDADLHLMAAETGCAPGFLRELTGALLPHGVSLQPERVEELYVLLVEDGRDHGVVGLLSLQLMSHGTGDLYPQHDFALVFRDQQFCQAERDACAYVRSLGVWPEAHDVRWHLSRPFDNRPVRHLMGASMGAAFALGLAKLGATGSSRTSEKLSALDLKQVAISATCDASGRLGRVQQMGPKILAGFDEVSREFLRFIVVSSQSDIPRAWQTRPFSSPQVILADTCADAVDILHEKQYGPSHMHMPPRPQASRVDGSSRQRKRGMARMAHAPWTKAAILGWCTALIGLAISVLPLGLALEERFGLGMLFGLRGVRPPPAEMVIVNVDRDVAARLHLPLIPETWPRSLHAQLTERLVQAGATAIAFDILFKEARSDTEDRTFATAIRQAQNVVLFTYLRRIPDLLHGQGTTGALHIERIESPIAPLAQAATALAPFPLPKVPVSVRQYWTFKTGIADQPTLPVVMFQLVALDVYDTFRRLVEDVQPSLAAKLPQDRATILRTHGVTPLINTLRDLFSTGQLNATRLLERLQHTTFDTDAVRKQTLLRSLIDLYQPGNSRYINFYGPPGTIQVIPYDRAVHGIGASGAPLDLHGKAVFVGFSAHAWPERQDDFHTVFSQADGADLSGIEIAATAFANLLEDKPVRLCRGSVFLLIISLWGILLGLVCRVAPPFVAALGTLGLACIYVLVAHQQFASVGMWYPLLIPLGIQLPLAFGGAVLWRYIDTDKERRNVRQAARYYLPESLVDAIAKDVAAFRHSTRVLYGTCLFTDAEQYTAVSEQMTPEALGDFMNTYYGVLFEPVQRYGGRISDVLGDSVLAIWAAAQPEPTLQEQACRAALDIAAAIQRFKQRAETWQFPTRIALHTGPILMGNVGAYDRYEYRALGDIVNAASRIEGLNKILGTRILASQEVVGQLDGFLTRELGAFQLLGKSQALVIHELLCSIETAQPSQRLLCAQFAAALDAYRKREWDQAIAQFSALLHHPKTQGDGPSQFYVTLCEQYKAHPPRAAWTGVVRVTQK